MFKRYFSNRWFRLLPGIRFNQKKLEQENGNQLILIILIIVASWIVIDELRTSRLQALYFSNYASSLKFNLGNGGSSSIRFPKYGPYDERLGYSKIPEFTKQLIANGFSLTKQARMSPTMLNMQLPPIYPEKDQAGLIVLDRNRQLLYSAHSPGRVYTSFEAIPKLLTDTLLFIEDRDLLDSHNPTRNPALNWSRLDRAVFDQMVHKLNHTHETPGASTLVTQIEKFRHSPQGRTPSIMEKFRQMESASIRTYMDGENNMAERRKTVVAYLNTVPLSAQAGYGEILGIGDGMWVWYGRNFTDFNRSLNSSKAVVEKEQLTQLAETYKQALSLIIAQRRPSFYLGEGDQKLIQLTNNYLRLLESAGIISPDLLHASLPLPLRLNHKQITQPVTSFESGKAATLLRTELASLLAMQNLYDLDRFDMTANTTLDGETQRAVSSILHHMLSPAGARSAGLFGHNMLREDDNPSRLTYSFTLFERSAGANLLRVQTDSLNEPFDLNSGARLNLGSTAKLRTLITYLEIITRLHQSYSGMIKDELSQLQVDRQDVLSRWALDYFASHPHCSLPDALEAAMERTYSGSPSEAFLTGGGMQRFENFEPEDNGRIITVREGFQRSINLVFVRLMRDIVHYYEFTSFPQHSPQIAKSMTTYGASQITRLTNPGNLDRQAMLSRFADREGRNFLSRFYNKYRGKSDNEVEKILFSSVRPQPERLTVLFRSLEPDAGFQQFTDFMHKHFSKGMPNKKNLGNLYVKYEVDKYSLNDRGYLAGIHPLELWLVSYLRHNPNATLIQVMNDSSAQRQEVYAWLFKTRNQKAQDLRIHQIMEYEAFQKIAADWHKMGYPFETLTPSYASALGASGDRPASLAKLMGIIINKGMLMPDIKLESLILAQGTPYESHFIDDPVPGTRVLPVEVADVVHHSLTDVVQGGTGIRLKSGFNRKDGQPIEIGGKTGTGDQRFVTYSSKGSMVDTRAVNRSASFVFEIGDKFFGTITAYVHEPYAADYKFTSALTVQLLKSLLPTLQPIVTLNRN